MRTTDPVLRRQHHLTNRGWRLLGWLADYAVLMRFQFAQAVFPSLDHAQRRLRRLAALAAVEWCRRSGLASGGQLSHYALAHLGVSVLVAARTGGLPVEVPMMAAAREAVGGVSPAAAVRRAQRAAWLLWCQAGLSTSSFGDLADLSAGDFGLERWLALSGAVRVDGIARTSLWSGL
jgi:hypothetical protein